MLCRFNLISELNALNSFGVGSRCGFSCGNTEKAYGFVGNLNNCVAVKKRLTVLVYICCKYRKISGLGVL